MGDVAASLINGITYYEKFNAEFVNNMIRQDKSVKEIIKHRLGWSSYRKSSSKS